MIRQFFFISAFMFLNATNVYSQLDSLEKSLGKYAYQFYLINDSNKIDGRGSGFFVNKNKRTFFVSALHSFYDYKSKSPKRLNHIKIILPTSKDTLVLEQYFLHTKFFNYCEKDTCLDVSMIEINEAHSEMNYVNTDILYTPKSPIKAKNIYIVGFPRGKLDIVKAHLELWPIRSYDYIIKNSSDSGASGAPVLIRTVGNRIIFGGIYVGGNKYMNVGFVTKPIYLKNILKLAVE